MATSNRGRYGRHGEGGRTAVVKCVAFTPGASKKVRLKPKISSTRGPLFFRKTSAIERVARRSTANWSSPFVHLRVV